MGFPELIIVGFIALLGVVPWAVGVCVLVMLFNVRRRQDEMRARIGRLEQAFARR